MPALWRWLCALGSRPLPHVCQLLLTAGCVFCPLWLYQGRLESFTIAWDDFKLLPAALDWQRTQAALFEPVSSHFCPPVRLLMWGLVQHAGTLTAVPAALRWSPIVSLVLMLVVLHEFVQHQSRSGPAALAAVLAAGVTSVHFPAFALFVTSQIYVAVLCTLLACWCVQTLSRTSSWTSAIGAVFWAALAPAWFATGLVAGPVASACALFGDGAGGWRRCWIALLPVLGTVLFVAVALVMAKDALLDPANLGHQPLEKTFRPDVGLLLAMRASAEHVLRWSIGVTDTLDAGQAAVHVAVLFGLFVWLVRRTGQRRLLALGLLLAVSSNWLVYTFRSYWGFDVVQTNRWYLAFPHVGWSIALAAAVFPARDIVRPVSLRDAVRLLLFGTALFLLHRPIVVGETDAMRNPSQSYELRRLELLQTVCTKHAVAVDDVRKAIGPVLLGSANRLGTRFDGLALLVSPTDPQPRSIDDLRRRLERVLETGSAADFGEP